MMVADEEWMQGLTMAGRESKLVMLNAVHGHWSSDVVGLNTGHVILAYLSRKKMYMWYGINVQTTQVTQHQYNSIQCSTKRGLITFPIE